MVACRNSGVVNSYDQKTKRVHEYRIREYKILSVVVRFMLIRFGCSLNTACSLATDLIVLVGLQPLGDL